MTGMKLKKDPFLILLLPPETKPKTKPEYGIRLWSWLVRDLAEFQKLLDKFTGISLFLIECDY